MSAQVLILGDGQMGLVLAESLTRGGVGVHLWGAFSESIERLESMRQSPDRLPGFKIPEEVQLFSGLPPAGGFPEGIDLIVNAVPTQYIRSVWTALTDELPTDAPIVCVSKGIEVQTLMTPTEVLTDVLHHNHARSSRPWCVLSGPTIAREMARHQPAIMLAASHDADLADRVQDLFDVPWLRIYTSDDPLGVEVAGAVKNVIALAAGMVDGLELGYNAKSALLARGLAEIARLGAAMGARIDTFFGIAGVGDLATTCFCPDSRNRTCGEAIGRGATLEEALASTTSVCEGVDTTRAIGRLAERHGVDMPICRAVHHILFDGLAPLDALKGLMERERKSERIG